MARKEWVILPVLIQDPSMAGDVSRLASIVHPVVVRDRRGFTKGPACQRVAVVDFDFRTGKLGAPALFDPKGTKYRGVTTYRVTVPTRPRARMPYWAPRQKKVALEMLSSTTYDDPFIKVSVFGTVLRTIGLIQDPVALGREVKWAFPGRQLLVVPRAGELENAFYHRQSRSLQFYYGTLSGRPDRRIYSALSQDIVAHETTHAIVDGIAPDLYDALSSESLAIHEGLADITAALLTMRNREFAGKDRLTPDQKLEFKDSSRFTRIAEEFGRWRGYGEALRDICNSKTLNPDESDESRRVDTSSPHALSEVLSGALFDVFRGEFKATPNDPAWTRALRKRTVFDPARGRATYAANRLLSLIYKGLDWLPPGEASFGELIRAMLVADEFYLPNLATARRRLLRQAMRRHIIKASPSIDLTMGFTAPREGNLFDLLPSSIKARRKFVALHRRRLGIPAEAQVRFTCRMFDLYEPTLVPNQLRSETFFLWPVPNPEKRNRGLRHLLVKLRWMAKEASDLGAQWPGSRHFTAGVTIVFDHKGRVCAVLRAGADPHQTERRTAFLKRLLLTDSLVQGDRAIGPDGLPLQSVMRTQVVGNALSVSGTFKALHIVDDDA